MCGGGSPTDPDVTGVTADNRASGFTSINRINRSTQIRQQIEGAILRGDFRPGEKLPSERELAETFGVSRVSVREALRSLEALGMIRVAAGRGCFVTDEDRDGFAAPFRAWLSVHCDEVLELLKVREALDALAAGEAALNADQAAIEHLVRAEEAFERAASGSDRSPLPDLVSSDLAFHDTLAQTSGSALLAGLVKDLNTYLSEARRVTLSAKDRQQKSTVEHRAIIEAVRAHDPERARAAASNHVESSRASVRQLVAMAEPQTERRDTE